MFGISYLCKFDKYVVFLDFFVIGEIKIRYVGAWGYGNRNNKIS